MAEAPGQSDVYCSPGVHLLSAILQQATGMNALAFGRQHLFGPLGMTNVAWPSDPQRVTPGWGDLELEPQDIAKLGVLFANGGELFGKRIVSPSWVETATTALPGYEFPGWPEGEGRGYLWWLAPESYSAIGRGEQWVSVYPEEDLVVGLTGGGCTGDCETLRIQFVDDYVRAAVISEATLPADPLGAAELAGRVAAAAVSHEQPHAVAPLPPMAEVVSGRTYVLLPNANSLEKLHFEFPGGDEAVVEVTIPELAGGPTMDLTVGLDDVFREGMGRYGLPAFSKGSWEAPDRFVVMVDEVGLIVLWRIELTFSGDQLTGTMVCLAGGRPDGTFSGTAQ